MSTHETSGPRAHARRTPATHAPRMPERLGLALPAGFLARIDRAAAGEAMTRAEWTRAALKRALDLARKKRRAAKQ